MTPRLTGSVRLHKTRMGALVLQVEEEGFLGERLRSRPALTKRWRNTRAADLGELAVHMALLSAPPVQPEKVILP